MNNAYNISKYDKTSFCAYLAHQTNTNFNYLSNKNQIKYIHNYLEHIAGDDNDICVVYENEYIDKNYLDDYTAYYVNCFNTYAKTTSRVHFFKYSKLDEYKKPKEVLEYLKAEFSSALNNNDSIYNSDNYLGFIIVRPIPKTFLGRVCLRPYTKEKKRLEKVYLSKEYNVSLFGIKLSINSIAFQEQDKILSACATTALWSFYHAHQCISKLPFPSSSEITKSAYSKMSGYSREFPNSGLSTDMICRSLRSFKLYPEYFELKESRKVEKMKEMIFAYCSSNIPLILGIIVSSREGQTKGLHAVTVLGYGINNTNDVQSNLIAHSLDKIYVHDDRYGPFLRIGIEGDLLKVSLDESSDNYENYEVDTLILGLYPKIRIPYFSIKNTCISFAQIISNTISETNPDSLFKDIKDDIKWDISIKENAELKHLILTENNIDEKEEYLTKKWSKYLWSAVAIIEGESVFQLLFDATDIEQSNVFIEYIPYIYDNIGKTVEKIARSYSKQTIEFDLIESNSINDKEEHYVDGIINYFNKKEGYLSDLDKYFGYLKTPFTIKSGEFKEGSIIDSHILRANLQIDGEFTLEIENGSNDSKYIWVIDSEGFLILGIEKRDSQFGHPTLTNGRPARIGGELFYEEGKWFINGKSGRYSSIYTDEEENTFLKNAKIYKFNSLFPTLEFEVYSK